jgi:anaerobic selenocysteine-containing dehydrogenase
MNAPALVARRSSVCPHDCPSACALDVELVGGSRVGRVHGAQDQTYTAGVICAKVARYAERLYHKDRLLKPLRRIGPKGSGQYAPISWDDALDIVAEKFLQCERDDGAESVWPYHYAGTMGLVMRDGIRRLTHVKRYSGFYSTICVNTAWPGFLAGTGKLMGPDPREMAKADCVVIWGTNAVSTQVNVMTHAMRARKDRGAKIVVIDIYRNDTMKQADLGLCLRPGTDGALACATMHVLFRDGLADRAYLAHYTDAPDELEAHLRSRTPEWASAITGLDVAEIEAFAHLVGERKRTFFRLGYGFSRQRNGAANMHAAASIAAVTGAWTHEGGGAFHSNSGIYRWRKTLIEGLDAIDPDTRVLDQSRIGAVLCGEPEALRHRAPVKAMLVQSTNPATVAPNQEKVRRGFAREDLFLCVHEHFMTETAQVADIVLPATMFLEHDDLYQGGGHQHIMFGGKVVEPAGECRTNHDLICALAKRLGAEHRGFEMTPREIIDWTLQASGWGSLAELETQRWKDVQPPFEEAHFLKGFAFKDKRFHFKADWATTPFANEGLVGPWRDMPTLPDHWASIEGAEDEHPFRLATSPSRSFLNTSFTETLSSADREKRPTVMIHPEDATPLAIDDGDVVTIGNRRGETRLHARLFSGLRRGVLISEGIWPSVAFLDGKGINVLTGDDPVAPFGGAAFHDNRVWLKRG